jgi:hypothetical protein
MDPINPGSPWANPTVPTAIAQTAGPGPDPVTFIEDPAGIKAPIDSLNAAFPYRFTQATALPDGIDPDTDYWLKYEDEVDNQDAFSLWLDEELTEAVDPDGTGTGQAYAHRQMAAIPQTPPDAPVVPTPIVP